MDFENGVQFDPGFIQHMSAFIPNIEYVYNTLAAYRDFNRKKQQFRMYYPKIQSLLKNYIGFYLGCILWAVYIKQFDNKPIINNLCYGGEYDEKESLGEVDFIINYLEQLKKDVKYYTGQNFSLDSLSMDIIAAYREFLKINEGFVKTQTTNDVKIPETFKTPSNYDEIYKEIEKVCENGKLYELFPLAGKIL